MEVGANKGKIKQVKRNFKIQKTEFRRTKLVTLDKISLRVVLVEESSYFHCVLSGSSLTFGGPRLIPKQSPRMPVFGELRA